MNNLDKNVWDYFVHKQFDRLRYHIFSHMMHENWNKAEEMLPPILNKVDDETSRRSMSIIGRTRDEIFNTLTNRLIHE